MMEIILEFFNFILLSIYSSLVIYNIIINVFIDQRSITKDMINIILNQNCIFSIISIVLNIYIIFIKYQNSCYLYNNKLLKKDINILREKTLDLKKQLYKNILSIHIKKYYIQKLIKEEYICPICLEIIKENNNVFLTLCGHLFHYNCLNKALSYQKKCPSCMRGIYINNFQIENHNLSRYEGEELIENEEPDFDH